MGPVFVGGSKGGLPVDTHFLPTEMQGFHIWLMEEI